MIADWLYKKGFAVPRVKIYVVELTEQLSFSGCMNLQNLAPF